MSDIKFEKHLKKSNISRYRIKSTNFLKTKVMLRLFCQNTWIRLKYWFG